MRPIAIIVVVATLAAGITAMLAKSWLDRQETRRAKVDEPPIAEILVVARDVASGAALVSDDLRYESWPRAAVTPRLVVRQGNDDAKAAFVGMIARRSLTEGEPVSASTTFRPDNSGVLAGLLAPGKRAISLAITNPTAVSGFITPGDRVDVVLATDLRKADEAPSAENNANLVLRFAAETILSDLRVLAIDQQITRGRDGAPIQGKTATLEVTPKQAELLTTAGMLGTLQLSLRPQQGDSPAPAAGADTLDFTADLEASKVLQALAGYKLKPEKAAPMPGNASIRVNRAGQVSSEGMGR